MKKAGNKQVTWIIDTEDWQVGSTFDAVIGYDWAWLYLLQQFAAVRHWTSFAS